MATLINPTHPYLRIYIPESGEYAQFVGGKLVIDEDDPSYAAVMDEAVRNPHISIVTTEVFCPRCGEGFTSKAGAKELAAHVEEVHFEDHLAAFDASTVETRTTMVKERAGYACDVCQPIQVFGDEADLANHMSILHAASPDEEPAPKQSRGPRARRPGEVG